jgi:hypothetical protein
MWGTCSADWLRSGLAVFDARFYIRVCRFDELVQGGSVGVYSWFQLYVAHELAGALQYVGWIQ